MNTEQAFKKIFTEDAVLIYSGIEFQIEVPEKMNELHNNSVLDLGVLN